MKYHKVQLMLKQKMIFKIKSMKNKANQQNKKKVPVHTLNKIKKQHANIPYGKVVKKKNKNKTNKKNVIFFF